MTNVEPVHSYDAFHTMLARLTKPWLLTISLNCIEMNRRLLVNNDFILHSLLGKLTISLITRA